MCGKVRKRHNGGEEPEGTVQYTLLPYTGMITRGAENTT